MRFDNPSMQGGLYGAVTAPRPLPPASNPQPQQPSQYAPRPGGYGTPGQDNRVSNTNGTFKGMDPSHPGYVWAADGTPIPVDTGMMGDQQRQVQKWGTDAPKGYALPQVRVPGVDFDPSAFHFNGVNQTQWNGLADQYQGRSTPTGDWAQANGARDMMGNAAGRYLQMANGQGPNLGQAQLNQGVDQSIAAQMAMANSGGGGSLAQASAMHQAQQMGQDARTQAVNQAAIMQQQQQLAGLQGYGSLAGNMRNGDMAQQQAALSALYQGRGQNDAMSQGLYGLGHQASMAEMGGRQAFATTQGQADLNTQVQNAGLEQGIAAQEMGLGQGIAGATLGAAGGLFGAMFGGGR